MPSRKPLSLLLSLLLLLAALGGGAGAGAEPGPSGACPMAAPAAHACPCQASQPLPQAPPDNACHCPADSPCQVSKAPQAQAPEMVLGQLQWPQAPGLAAGGLPSLGTGPVLHLASRPVPPAPPPEALYLQKSSLLI